MPAGSNGGASDGHRVEIVAIIGVEGSVESITLFNTILSHADRSRVVIPNRKVIGEILHNYGRIRQTQVTVGVAYGTDLKLALSTVSDLVRSNSRVLADPAPLIQITALDDSAIAIAAKPWVAVADYGLVESELNLNIVEAMRRLGIEMPFPQYQVHLLGAPESSAPGSSGPGR